MDVSFPGAAFVIVSCKESQLGCRKEWVPQKCSMSGVHDELWFLRIHFLFNFSNHPLFCSTPLAPAFTRLPGLESWCMAWATKCVEMDNWIWWRRCAIHWMPHLPTQALPPLPSPTNTPQLSYPLIKCTSNWVSISLPKENEYRLLQPYVKK